MCDSESDARVRAMSAPARSAPDTKVMNSSVEMREMRDDHSSLRRSDKGREPERAGTSLSDQRSKCHGWSEGMDDVTVIAQAIWTGTPKHGRPPGVPHCFDDRTNARNA